MDGRPFEGLGTPRYTRRPVEFLSFLIRGLNLTGFDMGWEQRVQLGQEVTRNDQNSAHQPLIMQIDEELCNDSHLTLVYKRPCSMTPLSFACTLTAPHVEVMELWPTVTPQLECMEVCLSPSKLAQVWTSLGGTIKLFPWLHTKVKMKLDTASRRGLTRNRHKAQSCTCSQMTMAPPVVFGKSHPGLQAMLAASGCVSVFGWIYCVFHLCNPQGLDNNPPARWMGQILPSEVLQLLVVDQEENPPAVPAVT